MKKRLFLDTNIILDLLGEREPYYEDAAKIASLSDTGKIEMVVSALTFSTVHYVLSRFENEKIVREKLRKLSVIANTADLTSKVIEKALSSSFSDFEDALQYYCASDMGCHILITRNERDFKNSDIPVMNSKEFISSFL